MSSSEPLSSSGAGQDYRLLKPSIGISLLVHDLFKEHPEKAVWHFILRDEERPHVQLGDALQVHIIELTKAEKQRQLPTPLQAWVACLLHNLDEAAMNQITHPPVKEALKHLETMYSDEALRLAAERRAQALVDAEDIVDYALHEGERIGVEKGREEGLQRGRQEGLQEGAFGILENQLSRKFGPLSPDTINRLRQADTRQLQAWSLSVLDAETLEHVFKR